MSEPSAAGAARLWHERLRAREDEVRRLSAELADARRALNAADVLAETLRGEHRALVEGLHSSRAYQWLLRLAAWRERLAPAGSARERALHSLKAVALGRPAAAVSVWTPPATSAPPAPPTDPAPDEYALWIAAHEPDADELREQAQRARGLPYRPLFSVLTPVLNTPAGLLRDAVASVRAQTYPNWELVIADGGSDDPGTVQVLAELEADPRVQVLRLAVNGGISENTNAALAAARGEFVALLDHDDLLAPDALYEMAARLNADPRLDVLYSDKDHITEDGRTRYRPFFKPGWSPALMLGANVLTHLTVLRTELVRSVGGFRKSTDGAQDWDLFLRVAERTDRIGHVPKVLYHWRVWGRSCSAGIEAKAYAIQAQVRTLSEHLARTGRTGRVRVRPEDLCVHVQRVDTTPHPVGVVLTARGPADALERLGRELLTGRYCAQVSLAVAAADESAEVASVLSRWEARGVKVFAGKPVWSLRNAAARAAGGDFLLFLDGGLEPRSPEWLDEFLQWATQPGIGVVGGRVSARDGSVVHQGLLLGLAGSAATPFAGRPKDWSDEYGLPNWYRNYLAVAGSCLMARRDLFESLGGFDEGFRRDRADADLCLRAREAGWEVFYNPYAAFTDHAADEVPAFADQADEDRFGRRWSRYVLGGDPYLNLNFARESSRMVLRMDGLAPNRLPTARRAA